MSSTKEQDSLVFSGTNAWESYTGKAHMKAMNTLARDYMNFLSTCKTERETVVDVITRLQTAGYSDDFAFDKVFRECRQKAVFVARRGKKPLADGIRLISAHTDSPRLDFKQHPLIEQVGIGQAKTHYYGGIRKYQWLARPLALHGVIVREDGTRIDVRLGEDAADPVFTIADLLPHLAQKENTKTLADAFEAEKLNVIMGHSPKGEAGKASKKREEAKEALPVRGHILELLHKRYAIREEDLFSAEIQAVPAGPARFVGLDESLIGGYGHDDRVCVYTALKALLEAEQPEYTSCLIFWDKEEIGSEGSTGAQSRFLENCLQDLAEAWEPATHFRHFITKSKALSADVHGAIDPDWQELHEKNNASLMGHGPCFCKFTGSRGKYGANDAHPEYIGWLRKILNKRSIPWQMAELGKVDLGGGGTVALYLAAYGMDVIDCGPSLLGMHSPFELVSKVDVYATMLAYKAFFEEK